MGLKSKLFKALRIYNNVQAVRKGRVHHRTSNSMKRRIISKLIRKFLK